MKNYLQTMGKEATSLGFWRDVIAELLGTFFLVSVLVALVMDVNGNLVGNLIRISLGMGLVVVALVEAFGTFGGVNINPAVTIGLAVIAKITILRAILYIIAQLAGGIVGAAFIWLISGDYVKNQTFSGGFAVTGPGLRVDPWRAMLAEAWATALLMFVVLGATNMKRRSVFIPALPIGLAVGVAHFIAIPYSGANINPARALGPTVIRSVWDGPQKAFENHWVYWVGPIGGAVIASVIYFFFNLADYKKLKEERESDKSL